MSPTPCRACPSIDLAYFGTHLLRCHSDSALDVWDCGLCSFRAACLDEITAHCFESGHSAERVRRGFDQALLALVTEFQKLASNQTQSVFTAGNEPAQHPTDSSQNRTKRSKQQTLSTQVDHELEPIDANELDHSELDANDQLLITNLNQSFMAEETDTITNSHGAEPANHPTDISISERINQSSISANQTTMPNASFTPSEHETNASINQSSLSTSLASAEHQTTLSASQEHNQSSLSTSLTSTEHQANVSLAILGPEAGNLVCEHCSDTFLSMGGLRSHSAKAHGIKHKADYCSLCKLQFGSYQKYKHHMSAFHPHLKSISRIICGSCESSFPNYAVLFKHLLDAHQIRAVQECAYFNDAESAKKFLGEMKELELRGTWLVEKGKAAYYNCYMTSKVRPRTGRDEGAGAERDMAG